MFVSGMIVGVSIFIAGVVTGSRLDLIIKRFKLARESIIDKLREKDPLEGKNGLLSYRNLKIRGHDAEDDED